MRTRMIAALSMSLLAAGHAGCWVEPDPGMNEPDAGMNEPDAGIDGSLPECPVFVPIVIQHDQVCKPEDCGTNTPHVHGIAFDGLYVDGTPDQGFQVLGFRKKTGQMGVLDVRNGVFYATFGEVRELVVEGYIELEWHDRAAKCIKRYALEIVAERQPWLSWTELQNYIPVYMITALDKETESREPICKKDDGNATHAVLLVNEQYDVDHAKVLGTKPDWFTIACEGSALFKMRFAGYDPEVPTSDPESSTPEERQATLKMITADYCGDVALSFTEVGTPVRWQNEYGWCSSDTANGTKECPYFPVDTEIESHEAIWGPDGALCLDVPRLGKRENVEAICSIPKCDGATMAGLGGHWETFNPISSP
jgi:ADYC domain